MDCAAATEQTGWTVQLLLQCSRDTVQWLQQRNQVHSNAIVEAIALETAVSVGSPRRDCLNVLLQVFLKEENPFAVRSANDEDMQSALDVQSILLDMSHSTCAGAPLC
jgi:hypothetical protein